MKLNKANRPEVAMQCRRTTARRLYVFGSTVRADFDTTDANVLQPESIMFAKSGSLAAVVAVSIVFAITLLTSVGCSTRVFAGGDCLGYPCTAEGARSMLLDEIRQTRPDFLAGSPRAELDAMFDRAVERIGERGFTPESFEATANGLRRILADWPLGAEDVSARRLQQLRRGTLSICPIWPFC